MKKVLFSVLLGVFLCSCEPSFIRNGRKLYKAYLNKNLKDPASLVIYSEKYELSEDGNSAEWKVEYGAKNSFGGMERKELHFTSVGRMIWVGYSSYRLEDFE